MNQVMYKVPLDELYTIISSCNYNEESDFCPVLIKIENHKIIQLNKDKKYLLQVWTREGVMVFERPMEKPVCNWNISKDKLLF